MIAADGVVELVERQGHAFSVGDTIRVEEWSESLVVESIDPMGSFLKITGKSTSSSNTVERLLNPKTCNVLISKNGKSSAVDSPHPEELSKQRAIELDSIEAGMIIDARDRLWRVDGTTPHDRLVKVTSISGFEAEHEFFGPVEDIRPANHPPPDVAVVGNPAFQKLLLRAMKLDLLHGVAALISLQRSRVIPMSYQLVPVLMALDLPQARMLLADDVGLGKTVEAGMIISELIGRYQADRVLFVTPANLREQWQEIIQRFFHLDVRIMSSRHRRKLERELLAGGDPWGHFPYLIVSMDYAKQPHVIQQILQYDWDVIVIDEAHNVAKPHQNVPGTKPSMQRWELAKVLAKNAKHLLLLTATPHNGYRDSYASLLRMLNPDIVSGQIPNIGIDRNLALRHVCQRRRSDIQEWFKEAKREETPFPERDHKEEFIMPSGEQNNVIDHVNALSKHIMTMVHGGMKVHQRIARWTVMHFHKRVLSSPYALICSVKNRLEKIDELIRSSIPQTTLFSITEEDARSSVWDFEIREDLSEEEADARTDRVVFGRYKDFEKERKLLFNLLREGERITPSKDSKLYHLLKNVLPDAFHRSPKVIIFTRYKDTLDYLERSIKSEAKSSRRLSNVEIFTIYGDMNPPRRREVFGDFRDSKKGVLITTDCMAEGIDLQYASNQVIHYELPWNPNRLEQRNGRVDRFGQPEKKVYIRTLIMQDTLEAAILELLMRKAERIRHDYGFSPPFFGDDLAILDAIAEYSGDISIGPQKTLFDFIETRMERERKRAQELMPSLYSEELIKVMQEDSFYGQTNVQLPEVEERMNRTRKAFGSEEELKSFVEGALVQLDGRIEPTQDSQIYDVYLPEDLKKSLGIGEEVASLRATFSPRKGVEDPSLYVLDIASPLVSSLIDRVKILMYDPNVSLYGRTAALGSSVVDRVVALYNVRMRYVVNTAPNSIIEELVPIGVELYSDRVLDSEELAALMNSRPMSHGRTTEEIKNDLDEAIQHPELFKLIAETAEGNCRTIIEERKLMRSRLEADGLSRGLKGFDEVSCASQDIMTLTVYYPFQVGG